MQADEEGTDIDKRIRALEDKVQRLEREQTLLFDGEVNVNQNRVFHVGGDFFQVMAALKSLYIDQEEDLVEIERISHDIEEGKVKVDMADLMFRFFIRQEIQNSRLKLILLSQNLDIDMSLFDQLDDLAVLIDDPRYSIHQVILGWKRFERDVSSEIRRLGQR